MGYTRFLSSSSTFQSWRREKVGSVELSGGWERRKGGKFRTITSSALHVNLKSRNKLSYLYWQPEITPSFKAAFGLPMGEILVFLSGMLSSDYQRKNPGKFPRIFGTEWSVVQTIFLLSWLGREVDYLLSFLTSSPPSPTRS